MKNKLKDLTNHLFEALERINDDDLTPEMIETEAKRVKSISMLSTQIIKNVKTQIDQNKLLYKGDIDKDGLL